MCVSEFEQLLVFFKAQSVNTVSRIFKTEKKNISEDFNQAISNMAENKDLLVKSHVEEHVLANANTAVCKIRDPGQSVTQTKLVSHFKSLVASIPQCKHFNRTSKLVENFQKNSMIKQEDVGKTLPSKFGDDNNTTAEEAAQGRPGNKQSWPVTFNSIFPFPGINNKIFWPLINKDVAFYDNRQSTKKETDFPVEDSKTIKDLPVKGGEDVDFKSVIAGHSVPEIQPCRPLFCQSHMKFCDSEPIQDEIYLSDKTEGEETVKIVNVRKYHLFEYLTALHFRKSFQQVSTTIQDLSAKTKETINLTKNSTIFRKSHLFFRKTNNNFTEKSNACNSALPGGIINTPARASLFSSASTTSPVGPNNMPARTSSFNSTNQSKLNKHGNGSKGFQDESSSWMPEEASPHTNSSLVDPIESRPLRPGLSMLVHGNTDSLNLKSLTLPANIQSGLPPEQ